MTLEAFYFIAQIIGGLAVIGSLIFVGIEVRRNTRAQYHQLAIERGGFFGKSNAWIMENGDLRKALLKGSASYEALSPEEKLIFSTYHQHWIAAMIALWSQEEMIRVEPKYSAAFYQRFDQFSRTPGVREWWESVRLTTPPQFLARFDTLMKYDPSPEGEPHK